MVKHIIDGWTYCVGRATQQMYFVVLTNGIDMFAAKIKMADIANIRRCHWKDARETILFSKPISVKLAADGATIGWRSICPLREVHTYSLSGIPPVKDFADAKTPSEEKTDPHPIIGIVIWVFIVLALIFVLRYMPKTILRDIAELDMDMYLYT